MQQSSVDHGERGIEHSSSTVSKIGPCDRIYDRSCSHCFVLQELFDNFDYHSRVDLLTSEGNTSVDASHLKILRYIGRHCGWLFNSILSCFAVQVSITVLQVVYSWSQQFVLVLNDLFVSDMPMEQLKRTNYRLGNPEVIWSASSHYGVFAFPQEWNSVISVNKKGHEINYKFVYHFQK